MAARIYRPEKSAMQSGTAKTKSWILEFEPQDAQTVEPLMGWTSSADTKRQLRLTFETEAEAVAYCERHAIPFQVVPPKSATRAKISYSDNFAFNRRGPWTH